MVLGLYVVLQSFFPLYVLWSQEDCTHCSRVFCLRSQVVIPFLAGIRTRELVVSNSCTVGLSCHFLFCGFRLFGPDRNDDLRHMEMSVNPLRCRRKVLGGENWKPRYRVFGDMVELTGVEVRIITLRSSLPLAGRRRVVASTRIAPGSAII